MTASTVKAKGLPLPPSDKVIEITGDELKVLLSRMMTVAMMERVTRMRLFIHNGRMSFQINSDLWSPAMGREVPK